MHNNNTYLKQKKINFGPYLSLNKIDNELRKELLDVGLRNREDMRSELAGRIENETAYSRESQEYFGYKLAPYFNAWFNGLIEHINYSKDQKYNDFTYYLRNMWLNVQREKEYNPLHFHSDDVSFVIYLEIDERMYNEEHLARSLGPGSIEFLDTIDHFYHKDTDTNSIKYAIKPQRSYLHRPSNGEIFIFPSYLGHHVSAFSTPGCRRISVSGNLYIEEKNG